MNNSDPNTLISRRKKFDRENHWNQKVDEVGRCLKVCLISRG